MAIYTAHLPKWKTDEVEEIKRNTNEFALTGLVDMYGIPASQLQQIRRNLKGKVVVKMTRNTLIEQALTELGGSIETIKNYISGQSALIFTNESPFKLYKELEKTKSKMYAKPGDIAPEDIAVSKGPTSFAPGPVVGELQQAGIPAAIESGKVVIKESKILVKKGEEIPKKIADAMVKLDIKPIDVGLLLQTAFHENTIYLPDMLAIDESEYYNKIVLAAQNAFNLSVNAAIPNKVSIEALLMKAFSEARNLGVEASIYEKGVINEIIGKAYRQMNALKGIIEGN